MTAPKKYPYKRRPRKSDPERQRKRAPHVISAKAGTQGKQSTQNPYLFFPQKPANPGPAEAEPKPKSIIRSLAARKPVPPAKDAFHDQRCIRAKPINFATSILGVRPWDKQAEILEALRTNDQVAVRSCNGAGKTFTAAVAIIWWLMSYDNAVVITTAPSERQVREILWRELRRLYMPLRDIIGGKLTRTRLEISPTRYAYGFSTNTEDRFQGFHSGNILVIVDEASGVDEFIYNAIDGVTTANNSKLLLIGNPHGYAGTFYDAFHKNRTQFHTVHISAFDLPAFKAQSITENNIQDVEYPDPSPVVPAEAGTQRKAKHTDVIPAGNTVFPARNTVIPAEAGTQGNINYDESPHGLSTPKWAIRVFNSHGPQSSIYQTRVLGQFPDAADDTLIPLRDVEAAVKRQTQIPPDTTPVMGVDVARFGNDKTVIIIRHGPRVIYIDELRKSDIVNTTGAVITAALKYQLKDIIVDEIGVGAGVLDNLKADKRFNAQGLNGSNAPSNTEKYLNLRAEVFDGLRQRFADGDISIPNDPELISQMASLTYKYNARGQLQLESKDAIRSSGRQSPDKADAIALAFTSEAKMPEPKRIRFFTEKTLRNLRYHQRHDPKWRD